MKRIKGIPHNLNEVKIGRVKKGAVPHLLLNDQVFVSDSIITNFLCSTKKVIVQISSKKNIGSPSIPRVILDKKDMTNLNEGDIVKINQNGIIEIISSPRSNDNYIFITNKCNSSCILCPQSLRNDENYYLQNLKILKLMDKNTLCVGLTGGEPLLEEEQFLTILDIFNKQFPKTKLEVLTNGRKLQDKGFVKTIFSINKDVEFLIPLYSDVEDIHNDLVGNNSYFETLTGIYNLARYSYKIEVRYVLTKKNFSRISKFPEFVYNNLPFVNHIAFMGMESLGNAIKNINDLWISPLEFYEDINLAFQKINNYDLEASIYNLPHCLVSKSLWKYIRNSISDWKIKYSEKCKNCILKDICGGFFKSSKRFIEKDLNPIKEDISKSEIFHV